MPSLKEKNDGKPPSLSIDGTLSGVSKPDGTLGELVEVNKCFSRLTGVGCFCMCFWLTWGSFHLGEGGRSIFDATWRGFRFRRRFTGFNCSQWVGRRFGLGEAFSLLHRNIRGRGATWKPGCWGASIHFYKLQEYSWGRSVLRRWFLRAFTHRANQTCSARSSVFTLRSPLPACRG